jgi:hypothetical protein
MPRATRQARQAITPQLILKGPPSAPRCHPTRDYSRGERNPCANPLRIVAAAGRFGVRQLAAAFLHRGNKTGGPKQVPTISHKEDVMLMRARIRIVAGRKRREASQLIQKFHSVGRDERQPGEAALLQLMIRIE